MIILAERYTNATTSVAAGDLQSVSEGTGKSPISCCAYLIFTKNPGTPVAGKPILVRLREAHTMPEDL